jgi:hypothetical protein
MIFRSSILARNAALQALSDMVDSAADPGMSGISAYETEREG